MLVSLLGTSLLGYLVAGKGTIKIDQNFWCRLILYQILKYKNVIKINLNLMKFIYSRNNLPKTKDGAYVINLDEYESIGIYWIAINANAENVTYFDSFGVEYMSKDIRELIVNKSIITNIYRI